MERMEEKWIGIPGYPGYEVSDFGSVRSWKPIRRHAVAPSEPRLLKKSFDADGYEKLTLQGPGGARSVFVHRIVLLSFVGPCPPGHLARHYPDPTPTNNRLSNLSWSTPLRNQHDRREHGTASGWHFKRKSPSPMKGKKHTPEARAKMRAAAIARQKADFSL